MKRYIDGACGPIESEYGYWVYAKDHDHEVEILKDTITALTHDYYAAVDRAELAETEVERLKADRDRSSRYYSQAVIGRREFRQAFKEQRDRAEMAEAEVKRLHEECAIRRQDCKRLRKERDELIAAMKECAHSPAGAPATRAYQVPLDRAHFSSSRKRGSRFYQVSSPILIQPSFAWSLLYIKVMDPVAPDAIVPKVFPLASLMAKSYAPPPDRTILKTFP